MVSFALRLPGIRTKWESYNNALKKQPLQTKAVTCMVGFALGDGLAQISTQEGPLPTRLANVNVLRTARMAGFGFCFSGPVGHFWYEWLERFVMPKHPMNPLAIAGKVAFDQIFYTPFGTAVFFAWNNILQFKPQHVWEDIHDKLWPTMSAGWRLWPPAMVINMAFIPPHLRIVYINAVSLVWTNILSRLASTQPTPDADTVYLKKGPYKRALKPVFAALDDCFDQMEDVLEPVIEPITHAFEPIQEKLIDPVCDRVELAYENVKEWQPVADLTETWQEGVEQIKDALPIDTCPNPKQGIEMHPFEAFPFVGPDHLSS